MPYENELDVINRQIEEAKNTLQKLNSDIVELEARRSNIKNEIASIIDEATSKQDKEYALKLEKLEKERSAWEIKNKEREKYLDDYMVRLDKQNITISEREKIVSAKENIIAQAEVEFNSDKEKVIKQLEGQRQSLEAKDKSLDDARIKLMIKEKELNDKDTIINGKELSNQAALEKIQAERDALESRITVNNELTKRNEKVLEDIKKEKKIFNDILDDINKQKEELTKLSVYKDDLVKLQSEKEEFEKQQKSYKIFSKQVEARDIAVRERETTATEKEKYLIIKEREVQQKIEVLNKIRQSQNA